MQEMKLIMEQTGIFEEIAVLHQLQNNRNKNIVALDIIGSF
jgi:hypothetical protein